MSLEHRPQDLDLLTPEEAQQVISLYAEREKKRLEEAERLAAMPSLDDLAALLNIPVESVRKLAREVQMNLGLPIEWDEEGRERVCKEFADKIIVRAGEIEKQKQAELERLAQMTSIKDVAAGLGITPEEAEKLLKEVRVASAPAPSSKFVSEVYEKSVQRQQTNRSRLNFLMWLLAFMLIMLVLAYNYYSQAGIYFAPAGEEVPSYSYEQRQALGQSESLSQALSSLPPMGWHIGIEATGFGLNSDGMDGRYLDDEPTRRQLISCLRSTIQRVASNASHSGLVADPKSVPFKPIILGGSAVEIPGWAVVTVSNKTFTREAYVNLDSVRSKDPQIAADFTIRLKYLVSGNLPKASATIQMVSLRMHPLPAGIDLYAFSNGKCLRFEGSMKHEPTFTLKDNAKHIELALAEAADILKAKGLNNKGAALILCSSFKQQQLSSEQLSGNQPEYIQQVASEFAATYP